MCTKKARLTAGVALAWLFSAGGSGFAQGTMFTYQGSLKDGGSPANGVYDLRFTIYDSTNIPGNIVAGPITNSATAASNGLFMATLDFGAGVFNGSPRWLEIAARTNGAVNFVTLSPRQPLTAAPYAVYAASAPAGNLTGTIPAASLPAAVVTNGATNVNITGAFSGNGAGLTNVPAAVLTGVVPVANGGTGQSSLTGLSLTNLSAVSSGTNNVPFTISAPAGINNNVFAVTIANTNAFSVDSLGNINIPDYANLLFGGNDGSLFWNPAHPGGGEFQFTSVGSMSINVGYGGQGFNTLQIGSSGGTHENVNFQYDVTPDPTHVYGYSKMVNFVFTYYNNGGVQYPNAYPQLRGEAVDQSGDGQLAFYNPGNVQVGGYGSFSAPSRGVLQGAVLSNGWVFNNMIRNNLLTATATGTYYVDFNTAKHQVVNLTQNTVFVVTNIGAVAVNQIATIQMDIFPSISSLSLTFPANWIWVNESGTAISPTNISAANMMRVTVDAEVGQRTTNFIARTVLAPYSQSIDPDATNFFGTIISAGGSVSATESNAVNGLALSLKTAGLWSMADFIYPMIGSSPTAMSFNLIDPNRYRITWHGTNTFTANGVMGDGYSGYGDTGFNPSTGSPNYSLNSASIAVYTQNAAPTNTGPGAPYACWMGDVNTGRCSLYFNGEDFATSGPNDANGVDFNFSAVSGFLAEARTSAASIYGFCSSTAFSLSSTSTAVPNGNFYLLAEDNAGLWHPTTANLSFAWAGAGLSAAQMNSLNSIVAAYETNLGRQ